MIEVIGSKARFNGNLLALQAEMAVAISEFKKMMAQKFGRDTGNAITENVVRVGMMSKRELEEYVKRMEECLKRDEGIQDERR